MVTVAVDAMPRDRGLRKGPHSKAEHMSPSSLVGEIVHIGTVKVMSFESRCLEFRMTGCRHCTVVEDSCPGARLVSNHYLRPSQSVDSAACPTRECHSGQLQGTDSDMASRCRCSDLAAALDQRARD